MNKAVETVFQSAMALPPDERDELVESLIAECHASLRRPFAEEWMVEVRRRSAEIDAGADVLSPWAEAKERARKRLTESRGRPLSACEFEELAPLVCFRPAMYLGSTNFDAVCGFLDGFNTAKGGVELSEFAKWLVRRIDGYSNHRWPNLVRIHLDKVMGEEAPSEDRLIEHLGELFEAFFGPSFRWSKSG